MDELMAGWPFWVVYVTFFCGAMVRAHVTYALGRGLRAGAQRRADAPGRARPEGRRRASLARAEAMVSRVGAPIITLSFLTVGVQTLLNAAAGALRMPLRRYTPACVVGALLWAALYTTAGFAVVDAALGRLPRWWLGVALALVAVVVLLTLVLRRRLERAGQERAQQMECPNDGTA